MTTHNIVSVSGGKDSTALLLLAQALEVPNMQAVFADTGHEHPETYEYVHYLAEAAGVPIQWVRADFTAQIARKREFVATKWREQGVREHIVAAALEVLQPTGIPYLDLCLWKGRFPSRRAQFCTDELKRDPIITQVFMPLMDGESMLLSWQGVRLDESQARRMRLQGTGACVKAVESVGGGAVQLSTNPALDCRRRLRSPSYFRHQAQPSLPAGLRPRWLHAMRQRLER